MFSRFHIFCAYTRPRYQVSVYRTIGPLVSICLEDRNVFARFDKIPLMTLEDIKETVYTKAIKNYKGK